MKGSVRGDGIEPAIGSGAGAATVSQCHRNGEAAVSLW
jgi:hypothetical protein